MSISKSLEERLKTARNADIGKLIVKPYGVSVGDISYYLSHEKIRHCLLPEISKLVIGHATYQEINKLSEGFGIFVTVTDTLNDNFENNVLQKLDFSISFNSVPLRGNGYDVKNAEIFGSIRHTSSFNGSKYGITVDKSPVSSLPHGFTFEKLFYLILDPEVVYARASRKLKPKKR